jgi:hypothetical protein
MVRAIDVGAIGAVILTAAFLLHLIRHVRGSFPPTSVSCGETVDASITVLQY